MAVKILVDEGLNRHIGAVIRARRLEAQFSQRGLADAIGVTFQQIQKYERGANSCSAHILLALSRALQCDVNTFFAGYEGRGG